MFQRRQMERLPALHLAVVALLAFCCLIHGSTAEISLPPASRVLQETKASPASSGSNHQQESCCPCYGTCSGNIFRACSVSCNINLNLWYMINQAVFAGETDAGGVSRRMDLGLEDYPGSGANARHSPWGQERRN